MNARSNGHMSDDDGTHHPAETAPPAEPGVPAAKDLTPFWMVCVVLTVLGIPVSLVLGGYLDLAVIGCDPASLHIRECDSERLVVYLPMIALVLSVVSYVIGGILGVRRPRARARNVHWMSFVISAVVYVAGCVVAWSVATPA